LARLHTSRYLHDHWGERKAMVDDLLSRTKDSDAYWHACALKALGWLCWQSGSMKQQALEAFIQSAEMMKDLGCTSDRVSALYGKAWCLDRLCVSDEEVHRALQETWEIARHVEFSNDHGAILVLLGLVFVRMGRLVDAMNAFEKSLGAYQYIGSGLGIALALDHIGFVYLHTGAYSDAFSAFEAAADAYAGLGKKSPDGRKYGPRCRENMARIKQKQENPHQRIWFYRPRSAREEKELFYPPNTSHP